MYEYLIKVIIDSILYLSPIKNTNKDNTKYSIIGIIDIYILYKDIKFFNF